MKPRICRGSKLCSLVVLCVLFLASALATNCFALGSDALPPLYLTIVVHNEEDTSRGTVPKRNIPDYDGNPCIMNHFARGVRPLFLASTRRMT